MVPSKGTLLCIFSALFIFFITPPVFSQTITEKYRTGNDIEGLTYVRTGDLANKFVFKDSLYIYSYDLGNGAYEKLFSVYSHGIGWRGNDVCSISAGEFAGNLLINNLDNYSKLGILSPTGDLEAEVMIPGFENIGREGLTEITSGPYNGMFAICGLDYSTWIHHIYIFDLVKSGETVTAQVIKDIILEDQGVTNIGLCFLPEDDHIPVEFQNMFLVSRWMDPAEIAVVDDNGIMQFNRTVDSVYEGLTFIDSDTDNESFAGKIMFCDHYAKDAWAGNLDGSDRTDLPNIMAGFGYPNLRAPAWLHASEEMLLVNKQFGEPFKFIIIGKSGFEEWEISRDIIFTALRQIRDITEPTPDAFYYVTGLDLTTNPVTLKLNPDFQIIGQYPMAEQYARICLLANPASALDYHFAMVPWNDRQKVRIFDTAFTFIEEIDLSPWVSWINDIHYDSQYDVYIVMATYGIVALFDAEWDFLGQISLSHLSERGFQDLTKITSGDLENHYVFMNTVDSEMFFIPVKTHIVTLLAANLIEELLNLVESMNLHNGIDNSLDAKLENAKKSLESVQNGNHQDAINKLQAFINECEAQKGGKLTDAQADLLISQAQEIINLLQTL